MRTVELLLDPVLEDAVRLLWARLHDAGLPSLATHRHPTNRPHLTLLTAASLGELPGLPLPVPAVLGPARMLGRALVLEVEAGRALRDLRAAVWRSAAEPWPAPDEWVPHVSLALNVPAARRDEALGALSGQPVRRGAFAAARSYDTATRTVTGLAVRPATGDLEM
jgi:hypothetical protein